MFSEIRRMVGSVQAEEKDGLIEVSGVPANLIAKDIQRTWNTSRINGYMFTKMGRSEFTFPSFFGPDILYALETMAHDHHPKAGRRALLRIVEELKFDTWMSSINKEDHPPLVDWSRLNELTLPPLPHQYDFIRTYDKLVPKYQLKGFLLSSPAGTGKTITSLTLATVLDSDLVIVISPNNALYKVWQATFRSLFKTPQKHWVSKDAEEMPLDARLYAFHYEALDQALVLARKVKARNPVVVLDESHNFNDIDSQRTRSFIRLCQILNCQHVIWSSGTPLKALGSEAIPMLTTIDSFFNADVEMRFRKIFGASAKRALDILKNRMGLITFKVDKSAVVKREPIFKTVKVKIPNGGIYTLPAIKDQMKAFIAERTTHYKNTQADSEKFYNRCLEHFAKTLRGQHQLVEFQHYKDTVAMIRKNYDPYQMKNEAMFCNAYELNRIIPSLPKEDRAKFKDVRSVIKYVYLKIQGECLGRILGKARTQCNVDLVSHADIASLIDDSEKKTLIFSSYVEVVDKTVQILSEKGFNCATVYGATNKNVTQIVTQFETNENINPLVATYMSLSTAVPLIVANTVILLNTPFRSYELDQAVSRASRLGQDTQVYVFMTVLDTDDVPNISTRTVDILEWSMQQVEAIMGVKGLDTTEVVGMESFDASTQYYVGDSASDELFFNTLNESSQPFQATPKSMEIDRTRHSSIDW